jgi:alpha-D-ribose 1-methylphosphonate 5-triphosphate synthase subunit PhnH
MPTETAVPDTQLRPGFADPTLHAQQTFRLILDAMARPGTVTTLGCTLEPPPPLAPATAAAALTLFDPDTPVWLDARARNADVEAFLRFHCNSPIVDEPARAAFGVCIGWPDAFEGFAQGEPEYPDRSATLVVQLDTLESGRALALEGPGVDGRASMRPSPCPDDLAARWAANRARFPLGLDVLLTAGRSYCGLPRSVSITEG